jgi:hypothetical protein
LAYLWLAAAVVAIGGLPSGALAQGADADDEAFERSAPQLPVGTVPRYRATYFKSNTASSTLRTASIVSATNQSGITCLIAVDWRTGGTATSLSQSLSVGPRAQVDFCTRAIPSGITTCNATGALTFNEGNAVVGSSTTIGCERTAISARAVYTGSTTDAPVSAITDAKVVRIGLGNIGD